LLFCTVSGSVNLEAKGLNIYEKISAIELENIALKKSNYNTKLENDYQKSTHSA
jgi:hypothetical protein